VVNLFLKVVNVVWLCKNLTKEMNKKCFVRADDDAVYHFLKGWFCDCEHWTTGEDNYHIPVVKAKRFVYSLIFNL